MKVFIVIVPVLVLCNHACGGIRNTGQKKTWKYGADIGDRENWVDGKMQPDCQGIVFAEENNAPVFIEKIQVEELVLPKRGELWLLDGGSIQFGGKGGDSYVNSNKDYCVKLKPINYNNWYEWENWLQETNNSALPHQEHLPCFYDTVVFSQGYHARTYVEFLPTYVARLKLGLSTYQSQDDGFAALRDSEIGRAIFLTDEYENSIEVASSVTCEERDWPCPCHLESPPCYEKMADEYPEVTGCETPVEPYGFCYAICGAFLTVRLEKKGFDMVGLKRMLKEYESDTHASVIVSDYGEHLVQVVFSEKEYRMKSTIEIADLHAKLLAQKMQLRNYQSSGLVYVEGKTASTTLSLIFGTFFGVLLVFAIFFTIFKDGDARWFQGNYFRARFNPSRSFFDPLIFARFDAQNENLIVDGQSLSGSVQNLHQQQQRSFDNPLFGASPPSKNQEEEEEEEEEPQSVPLMTSSLVPQKSTEETNEVENPLYDIALKNVNEE